jgi:general secretion pathway protein K
MEVGMLRWCVKSMHRLKDNNRGSILILTLWSLFFLSELAIATYTYISPRLETAGVFRDRSKLRYLVKGGFAQAMLKITEDETPLYDALNESWANDQKLFDGHKLGEGTFTISYSVLDETLDIEEERFGIVDEERKINVNTMPQDVLARLFESLGNVGSGDANDLAAAIVDWRDADGDPQTNGAESEYYEALSPLGYPCKNAEFQVLDELLLVKGMTSEIFQRIQKHVTVFGDGRVNVNTADQWALESLGLSHALVEKIIDYRRGDDGQTGTQNDGVFESIRGMINLLGAPDMLPPEEQLELDEVINNDYLTAQSDHFLGTVTAGLTGRTLSMRASFIFDRDQVLHYWREW